MEMRQVDLRVALGEELAVLLAFVGDPEWADITAGVVDGRVVAVLATCSGGDGDSLHYAHAPMLAYIITKDYAKIAASGTWGLGLAALCLCNKSCEGEAVARVFQGRLAETGNLAFAVVVAGYAGSGLSPALAGSLILELASVRPDSWFSRTKPESLALFLNAWLPWAASRLSCYREALSVALFLAAHAKGPTASFVVCGGRTPNEDAGTTPALAIALPRSAPPLNPPALSAVPAASDEGRYIADCPPPWSPSAPLAPTLLHQRHRRLRLTGTVGKEDGKRDRIARAFSRTVWRDSC
jgi:hypothetical protein